MVNVPARQEKYTRCLLVVGSDDEDSALRKTKQQLSLYRWIFHLPRRMHFFFDSAEVDVLDDIPDLGDKCRQVLIASTVGMLHQRTVTCGCFVKTIAFRVFLY